MNIHTTKINGVIKVELQPYQDHRGAFARLFCQQELAEVIDHRHIVQVNHSRTTTVGAVRGLHYQHPPAAEMKLITCIKGRVWDVALDLRTGSSTYLQWVAQELSADKPLLWVIPEGCAHGFQVLEANSELLYLHTAFYQPEHEGGVRYNDPAIAINWPLPVADISQRDQNHPLITKQFNGMTI